MLITNNERITNKPLIRKEDKLIVNDLSVYEKLMIANLPQLAKVDTDNIIGFGAHGEIIPIDISNKTTKWQEYNDDAIEPKGEKAIRLALTPSPVISRMSLGYDSNGIVIPIIAPASIWKANELIPTTIEPDGVVNEVDMPDIKAKSLETTGDIEGTNIKGTTLDISGASSTNSLKVLELLEAKEITKYNDAIVLAFAADGTLVPCVVSVIDNTTTNGDLLSYDSNKNQAIDSGKKVSDFQLKLTAGYNISISENNEISCDIKTMTFKGSVQTKADLPENAEVGDVWNIKSTGENYCWDGTSWILIGTSVDLSGYYTKEQTDAAIKALIDDTTSSTDKVYSSSKTEERITDAEDYADEAVQILDSTVVHLTGTETISGAKTFNAATFSGANSLILPTTAGTTTGAIWVS